MVTLVLFKGNRFFCVITPIVLVIIVAVINISVSVLMGISFNVTSNLLLDSRAIRAVSLFITKLTFLFIVKFLTRKIRYKNYKLKLSEWLGIIAIFIISLFILVSAAEIQYKKIDNVIQQTEIIVQKKNYTLRTWQTEDAASLAQYLNNKNIWNNCRDGLPYPYSQEDANVFLAMVQAKENIHDFCIEVNGEAVGNIGFIPATDVERFSAEVGYWIGEPFWNQGIVTDALKKAINYYFEHTDKIRVFAVVFEHNSPSMRVLEKVGFTKVGIMQKAIFKNDNFMNAHYYELIK